MKRTAVDQVRKPSVEKRFDRVVSFAVERGEEEQQDAQHRCPQNELLPLLREFVVPAFDTDHAAGEIQGNNSAENAQQQHVWDTPDVKRLGL